MAVISALLVAVALRIWLAWYNAPERIGARGERWVTQTLMSGLPQDYHVMNDIYLPLPDGTTTQIDHVVVSRHGIFVVETKTYSGWIFGDEKSAQWTQTIYRKKSRFQNPIRQNHRHTCALADCLGVPKDMFKGIVVFNGGCTFKTEMPPNVMRRRDVVKYIRSCSEVLLKDKDVSEVVAAILEWSNSVGEDRRKAHVSNLQKRHSAVSMDDGTPHCPYCGKQMVLRTNRKTGDRFYGCSAYPTCRGLVKIS